MRETLREQGMGYHTYNHTGSLEQARQANNGTDLSYRDLPITLAEKVAVNDRAYVVVYCEVCGEMMHKHGAASNASCRTRDGKKYGVLKCVNEYDARQARFNGLAVAEEHYCQRLEAQAEQARLRKDFEDREFPVYVGWDGQEHGEY